MGRVDRKHERAKELGERRSEAGSLSSSRGVVRLQGGVAGKSPYTCNALLLVNRLGISFEPILDDSQLFQESCLPMVFRRAGGAPG